MDAHATYNESTWTIAAGDELQLPLHGEFVHVVASSLATFELGLDGDETGRARPGAQFRARPQTTFKTVRLRNPSGIKALIVTLGYGRGEFQLQQFRFLSAGTLDTTADASIAAGATQLVLPVNLDRRVAKLSNPFGNPREFRIGDSAAGAARGLELPPGAPPLEIETTAEIYAHNPDTSAMSISIMEEAE